MGVRAGGADTGHTGGIGADGYKLEHIVSSADVEGCTICVSILLGFEKYMLSQGDKIGIGRKTDTNLDEVLQRVHGILVPLDGLLMSVGCCHEGHLTLNQGRIIMRLFGQRGTGVKGAQGCRRKLRWKIGRVNS